MAENALADSQPVRGLGRFAPTLPPHWVHPLAGVVGGITTVALYAWRPEHVSGMQAGLVIVAFWATLGGCLWWYANRTESVLPVFPVSLVIYFASFPFAIYLYGTIWPSHIPTIYLAYEAESVDEFADLRSIILAVAGLMSYVTGFIVLRLRLAPRFPHFSLPRQYSIKRLRLLCWILIAGHLIYLGVPAVQQIPSIGQFFLPVGYLGFGILFYFWSRGRVGHLEAAAALGCVIVGLGLRLLVHWGLTPVVVFGLFFFFAYYYAYRRVPVVALLLVLATLFMSYGGVQLYRHMKTTDQWYERSTGMGVASDAINIGRLVYFLWVAPTGDSWTDLNRLGFGYVREDNLRPIVNRLALQPLMSLVAIRSPAQVPYWRGESYRGMLSNLVPRALWPGKPREIWGNVMGQRYGLLNPNDRVTSVNIPWMIELLANFGGLGVVLGMFAIGSFMATLDRFFNAADMTPLAAVSAAVIVTPLAYHDSNFTLMTGSLLPLTVCIYLYFRFGLTMRTNR